MQKTKNHLHSISKFRLADRLKVTLPFPTEVPYQGKTTIIRKDPPSNPFDPKGYFLSRYHRFTSFWITICKVYILYFSFLYIKTGIRGNVLVFYLERSFVLCIRKQPSQVSPTGNCLIDRLSAWNFGHSPRFTKFHHENECETWWTLREVRSFTWGYCNTDSYLSVKLVKPVFILWKKCSLSQIGVI